MSARRKARKRAIDILFGADVRETSLADALESAREVASAEPERASSWPYAQQIVEGILAHLPEIDSAIRAASTSWPLERMPAVDRAVLRLGAWELLHNNEVPPAVAISESVELVQELSTEASGGFVHGVLRTIGENTGTGEALPRQ